MTGRRVDPTGKGALFSAPVTAAPDRIRPGPRNEGRTALFSTPPRQVGTVVIECSRCRARTRTSVVDLALRLAMGSAWWPLRPYQHWVRCPACAHRQWCRIGWTE
jgi:hypothetical protein